jgi:hypothetical protein
MEMVEGGTRAEVASVLSEKLLAELSDRSQVALHPRSIWRSAAPVWAPATGVEPRVRFVECLGSLLCHACIAKNVYLIAMISIISTVLLRWLIRVPPLAAPHPPRPRRRSTPRRTHAHPAQDAATHASPRRHTHVPAAVPVTDRNTEQDGVDAHVEHCLRQLGFSACESHVLNGAGAEHHDAEHLVRDLGYSVDQIYELLRP